MERENQRIVRDERSDPTATIADIQRTAIPSMSHPVSVSTVGRRLHDARLHARRPLGRLPLTHVSVAKDCNDVMPDCHGVTQNGGGSSSVTSPAFVLVETTNESVCGGTAVSAKMNDLLSRVTLSEGLVSWCGVQFGTMPDHLWSSLQAL